MKNIFVGILASVLLSNAVVAGDVKKHGKKRVAKRQACNNVCAATPCNPANCINMPGCICK